MTANTSPSTTINAGAFAKLQILLPGETAAPGTASGKTGTPRAQTAGRSFNVTVNAVDANWNPVSSTDTVALSTSDANATPPAPAALVAGTKTFAITLKTAGSSTVTATDQSDGSMTASTSPAITVNGGAFAKLQILLPGETAAPGTAIGQDRHAVRARPPARSFNVTVNAVDANWNPVTSTDTVAHHRAPTPTRRCPANAALVAGTKTFSVTAKTAGTATFTATDITNGSKTANTSPSTTINAGAFAKLQILLPGETAAPGTASGKTGTPSRQTAGASFTVTVNAVDANWNVVSSTDTVGITSHRRERDAAVERRTRRRHQDLLRHGEDHRHRDVHRDGHQQRLDDGQHEPARRRSTRAPSRSSRSCSPARPPHPAPPPARPAPRRAQTAGGSFNVTVNAVDANWNPVTSTDTVAITSSDANATPARPTPHSSPARRPSRSRRRRPAPRRSPRPTARTAR